MLYDIFFEYEGGGTDHVYIEATSPLQACRIFRDRYEGRYVLSCEYVNGGAA